MSSVHCSHVVKWYVQWKARSEFHTARHKLVNLRTELCNGGKLEQIDIKIVTNCK
jgi:hypothetical protein